MTNKIWRWYSPVKKPTPVSALIHAATLVTAGLYLLVRSSPILEYSSTALLVITLVGASTAFFAATCGLVQNDLKRIIAFSTISQLGYLSLLIITLLFKFDEFIFIDYDSYFLSFLPFFKTNIWNGPDKLMVLNKDNLSYIPLDTEKFNDFSYKGRDIIKKKYSKIPGIYLWVNNTNNRCYVGKSINLYLRFSKYLSPYYITDNKTKMAICSAISKYGHVNFTFYVLETFDSDKVTQLCLSEKENFWYQIIMPSYNIQSILNPFSGRNHYRFGKKLSEEIKSKISKTLKGRLISETKKTNHVLGAKKKRVFCFDWETGSYLMEFEGIRIMMRALNIKNIESIRSKIDKNKPLPLNINGENKNLLIKSSKL